MRLRLAEKWVQWRFTKKSRTVSENPNFSLLRWVNTMGWPSFLMPKPMTTCTRQARFQMSSVSMPHIIFWSAALPLSFFGTFNSRAHVVKSLVRELTYIWIPIAIFFFLKFYFLLFLPDLIFPAFLSNNTFFNTFQWSSKFSRHFIFIYEHSLLYPNPRIRLSVCPCVLLSMTKTPHGMVLACFMV